MIGLKHTDVANALHPHRECHIAGLVVLEEDFGGGLCHDFFAIFFRI